MTTTTAGETRQIDNKREIFGWTMYDWANSAFSTTVGTVFLGPYVTSIAEQAADINGLLHAGSFSFRYDSLFAYAVSASVLMQVAFLPILGALADYSNIRKRLLIFFALLGSVATMLMYFITDGGHWFAMLLFVIANVSFGAGVVFYNAYLPDIASEDRRDGVSASGFAMGYAGGGLLLLLNLILFLFSDRLGLSSALVARISLASAGVWWLGFSTITFRLLRTRQAHKPLPEGETYISIGFSQLAVLLEVPRNLVTTLMLLPLAIPVLILLNVPLVLALIPGAGPIAVLIIFIIRKARTLPEAMKYLVAYLLYNDGIQTVIAVAAIFAAEEIGMSTTNLILVILMIQFVAFGGAYMFGWLAGKIGTKNAILLSLVIWCTTVIFAYFGMRNPAVVQGIGIPQDELEFWILGFVVAIVLGGSQALSRSAFCQMIPKEQEAEFFSFYEVSERGTSWLGTFIFARVNDLTGSLRAGVLSLIFFFVVGLILLPLVNIDKAKDEAKAVNAVFVGAGD